MADLIECMCVRVSLCVLGCVCVCVLVSCIRQVLSESV